MEVAKFVQCFIALALMVEFVSRRLVGLELRSYPMPHARSVLITRFLVEMEETVFVKFVQITKY
jgi:hypothetical protein